MPASDAQVPSRFVQCPGDGAPRTGHESLGLSPVVARVAFLLIERSIALLSFPMTQWLWACPPLDLCGWQYLAQVLVEGLWRRRPLQ